MKEIGLHVYHLDEGEEASKVVKLLEQAGVEGSQIERPTEQTNSIWIPIKVETQKDLENWKIRNKEFEKASELLDSLKNEYLNKIREMGLEIALRVISNDALLPIPSMLLKSCSRLELDLFIFSDRLL